MKSTKSLHLTYTGIIAMANIEFVREISTRCTLPIQGLLQ